MRLMFGMVGNKGAGKDTAADVLVKYGWAKKVSLAYRLKDVCSDVFCVPRYYFDYQEIKERPLAAPITLESGTLSTVMKAYNIRPTAASATGKHEGKVLNTPRQLLQYMGTEVLRGADPDIHCRILEKTLPSVGTFALTDVRFPNELEYFSKSFVLFPIYINNIQAEAAASKDPHEGERNLRTLIERCHKVDNNGTLAGLEDRMLRLFHTLTAPYKGQL